MNPEDVGRILDEIGSRIGPAGEYAWTLTVRQVYIESVAWGIAALVVLVVAVAVVIRIIGKATDLTVDAVAQRMDEIADERRRQYPFTWTEVLPRWIKDDTLFPISTWEVITASATVVAGIIAIPVGVSSLVVLLNPEYHAMIRLLERVVPG